MSDNADRFCQFIGLTWNCYSLLSGWVSGNISVHLRDLVNSSVGKDSVLMEPINISSDSDIDYDLSDEEFQLTPEREPTNSRILPAWATSSPASSSRNAVNGPIVSPAGRGYTSNGHGNLIHADGNSLKKLHNEPGSSRSFGAVNLQNSQANNALRFPGDGDLGHSRKVNPRIANVSGADYEKLSSQQALKRTLPLPVDSSAPGHRYGNFADVASSSQPRNAYGSMHYTAGSSSANIRGYRDRLDPSNDDDIIIINEKNGNRILPPSLVPGRMMPSVPTSVSNDFLPRTGAADERAPESDERLIYQAALQDLYQPKTEAEIPHGLLSVPLLRHQKIALQWMLQRETRSLHCLGGILADDQGLGKTISMIALVQMQRSLELSSKSEDNCNKKAEALNLDEDDDNVINNLDILKQIGESADVTPKLEVESSTRSFRGRRPAAGTLVVCPASVLRQWARELDEKVADESKLDVLIYHGGSRTKDPFELAKYDVVLTTYAIVTNEVPKQPLVDEEDGPGNNGDNGLASEFSNFKKQKTNISKKRKKGKKGVDNYGIDCSSGALARVAWSRVILDEAQTIKNHRTQVARACCSLRAKRRWCLSGTPIQNTIDDLYSYFRFLRYEPYNVYKSFINSIKVPISRNPLNGYKKLQVVLRGILLRRTKGTLINGEPIIYLPPKSICLNKVEFSSKERTFYSWLEADSRSKFKAFAAAGTVKQNYANILLMLLRLRQACDHPVLVKSSVTNSGGKLSAEMAERLPRDVVINLLNHLAASSAICLVCNDPPEDPVVTMCGHVFCYQCVSEYVTGDENACPARGCKEPLGSDVVFSADTLRSCAAYHGDTDFTSGEFDEESVVWEREYCSSKIKAVIDILQSHNNASSPMAESDDYVEGNRISGENTTSTGAIKSIIFSQWTGMLDLVEDSLKTGRFNYRRLDGTMSLAARDKAVKDFNNDPEVTVMIMSLKAGNLGLNMVAASHVIMLDLWWNPTTEDQAVDRAHRIGQTRPVTVTRLTINGTVEDRILALQEEKRKMVSSAFGEDQAGASATRLTQEDLRYLFNV